MLNVNRFLICVEDLNGRKSLTGKNREKDAINEFRYRFSWDCVLVTSHTRDEQDPLLVPSINTDPVEISH